jgi:hypothetical protein
MKVWIVVNCPASKPFHAVAAWAFANFPKERQTLLTAVTSIPLAYIMSRVVPQSAIRCGMHDQRGALHSHAAGALRLA